MQNTFTKVISVFLYNIHKWFLLTLTPIYLSLIYYKNVTGVDLLGLLIVSLIMFLLYLPIQTVVSESGNDLSIEAILHNKKIQSYLNALYLFILSVSIFLATIVLLPSLNKLLGNYLILIVLILYIMWLHFSTKLTYMIFECQPLNLLKMLGFFIFIIALMVVVYIGSIPYKFGFMYIYSLFGIIFKSVLVIVFAFPVLVLSIFGLFTNATSSTSSNNGDAALMGPGVLFAGLIIMIPTINWFSSFINSIDAYSVSLIFAAAMILISALGAYFQIRILIGTFVSSSKKRQNISLIFLILFYGIMIVNMHFFNTVEKNSKNIERMQFSVKSFNKSLQNRFDSN